MSPAVSHELRLRGNLRALRRLPHDTQLPRPSDGEERRLFDDLVRLFDGTDPIVWLREERGPLTAHITLQWAFDNLHLFASGVRDDPAVIQQADVFDAALWGLLASVSMDPSLFALAGHEGLASVTALRSAFAGWPHRGVALPTAPDEHKQLLADLLELRDAADPLAWLQRERGALSASIAFGRVLKQGLPRPSIEVGLPMRDAQVEGASTDRVRLSAGRVVFGADGFSLALHTHLHLPRPSRGDVDACPLPWWGGFDRISDDKGHRYLARHIQTSVSNARPEGDRWFVVPLPSAFETLHASFYPALATDAAALTFDSTASELVSMAGASPAYADLHIDPFTWRVRVH